MEEHPDCGAHGLPGFLTSGGTDACAWQWNGCVHQLFCTDTDDIALRIMTPTAFDGTTVTRFIQTYLETGPAHMIPDENGTGVVNTGQQAKAASATWQRTAVAS